MPRSLRIHAARPTARPRPSGRSLGFGIPVLLLLAVVLAVACAAAESPGTPAPHEDEVSAASAPAAARSEEPAERPAPSEEPAEMEALPDEGDGSTASPAREDESEAEEAVPELTQRTGSPSPEPRSKKPPVETRPASAPAPDPSGQPSPPQPPAPSARPALMPPPPLEKRAKPRPPACTPEIAQLIGRAYRLSSPINEQERFDQLTKWVKENGRQISSESAFSECATFTGDALLEAGPMMLKTAAQDPASESVRAMGATQRESDRVLKDLVSGAVDSKALGEELLWLGRAIPAAAAGNWEVFQTTATPARESFREVWPLYRSKLKVDSKTQQLFEQARRQQEEYIEYEVALLVEVAAR